MGWVLHYPATQSFIVLALDISKSKSQLHYSWLHISSIFLGLILCYMVLLGGLKWVPLWKSSNKKPCPKQEKEPLKCNVSFLFIYVLEDIGGSSRVWLLCISRTVAFCDWRVLKHVKYFPYKIHSLGFFFNINQLFFKFSNSLILSYLVPNILIQFQLTTPS